MKEVVLALSLCLALVACDRGASTIAQGEPQAATAKAAAPTVLSDIAGVWRGTDGTMVSIVYDERKLRLLFGANAVPVQVGSIDEINHTVNLRVSLSDGKPGIWTVAQVFDPSQKDSFTLQLTLHDGTQDQLSFVRKISNDDLNVIAAAESRVHAGSLSSALNGPEESLPQTNVSPPSGVAVGLAVDETAPWAPSFDCARAATGAERLICSNRQLSAADVALAQAYRAARARAVDKAALTVTQSTWRKSVRDACSDVQCMVAAYEQRLSELQ